MTANENEPKQKGLTVEESLLIVLQLEQKARAANSLQEWQFTCLNDMHLLVPFQQSLLWMMNTKN